MRDKLKIWFVAKLRTLSMRLDGHHLIVVPPIKNAETLCSYLTAMAHKKGFKAWRI